MRCCSRSTTSRSSRVAAAGLLVLAAALAGPARAEVDEADVRRAIAAAVARVVGSEGRVTVRDLDVRLRPDAAGSVFAALPGNARAGQPMRVLLKVRHADGRSSRFGEAQCVVDVSLPGVRARRPITRGAELGPGDVEPVRVDASGWILRPLPVDVEGARAAVDLAAGQVIQRGMIVPAPLVRSGEPVTLAVVAGSLRVETRAVATQPGRLGEQVRVINPDTGRRLSARVVGRGAVEVRHGT
jgi:flagella basal body P-ring formation protein FlgA